MITPGGAWCKGSPSYAGGERSPTYTGQPTIAVDDDLKQTERIENSQHLRGRGRLGWDVCCPTFICVVHCVIAVLFVTCVYEFVQ